MRKLTQEQFIARVSDVHENYYDYSNTIYINYRTHVNIICPVHGEFKILADAHINGQGCKACGVKRFGDSIRTDISELINRANNTHNFKYDYSLLEYNAYKEKSKIICPVHGVFEQKIFDHIKGNGCPKCVKRVKGVGVKLSQEDFERKSTITHNGFYSYEKSIIESSFSRVVITCPIHGDFTQVAKEHYNGAKCQLCANKKCSERLTIDTKEFIKRAILVHEHDFGYEKTIYINHNTPVEIFCKKHGGYFWQKPSSHLSGHGCRECHITLSSVKKKDWIEKSKNRIGTFYIIRCFNESESFYKYGITYNGVNFRYRNPQSMPYSFKLIRAVISTDKDYLWELEKRFGIFKKNDRYSPNIFFKGCKYECFSNYTQTHDPNIFY